ncbi:SpoIIE family protein phosphatase [Streptomyces pinistramenti]|uniref:SpoIIE family protein phosphatase n=1 Tax=Streptomyces pinistramenti TaxID=2884812 RepID=UPI001D05E371|nr:SpoIIE family protein phosphatase [Streptomyces pinistramenti]MCB5906778.1 SpoIIE family protein phosphatase [Streptomyces pinistramenti]
MRTSTATATGFQRDTDAVGGVATGTGRDGTGSRSAALTGTPRAASDARRFVRGTLADWTAQRLPGAEALTERLAEEALLLVSELVTNAVVHAGTDVELHCRLEADTAPDGPGLVVEVSDHHPTRPVRGHRHSGLPDGAGHGLQLVGAVAESWGITYRRAMKTVWFRLAPGTADDGPDPGDAVPGARAPAAPLTGVPAARPAPDAAIGYGAAGHEPDPCATDRYQPAPYGADRYEPAPYDTDRYDADDGRSDAPYTYGYGYGYGAAYGAPPRPAADWLTHGAPTFLAEASDLLSGHLDADQVASLAAQLTVPRLADWCAVWLYDGEAGGPVPGAAGDDGPPRLSGVWHSCEARIDALRLVLEKAPPPAADRGTEGSAVPWPWPDEPGGYGGAALACPLVSGGRRLGTVLIGRAGLLRFPAGLTGLIEDLCRRVARAVATARAYSKQERISQVLQRRLLPHGRAQVPGVASAVVYEPRAGAWAGGDFWDLFEAGDGRWCFALGDVCGSGPEAAAVTGLARPVLRLLARDGFGVAEVLDRLNKTMAREAADSVAAVAAAVAAGAGVQAPVEIRDEGEQARFLSLLYGEIVPRPGGTGGARCTLASAGHPLPLVLGTDGTVRVAAAPQMLLGVVGDATYESESFDLAPGETLLCVTDGVTERRSGRNQFDDDDGLATALAACAGLDASAIAERIRRAVHGFSPTPPDDDLALLVLQAAADGTP